MEKNNKTNRTGYLNKFSGKLQMFIIGTCIIFIVAFVGFVFYPGGEIIKETSIKNYDDTLSERAYLMGTYIEHAEAYTRLFYDDSAVYNTAVALARQAVPNEELLSAHTTLHDFVFSIKRSDSSITKVAIKIGDYESVEKRYSSRYERKTKEYIFDDDTMSRLEAAAGKLEYSKIPRESSVEGLTEEQFNGLRMVRVGRILKDYMKRRNIGAIIIDLDVSDCFTGVSSFEEGQCILMLSPDGKQVTGNKDFDSTVLNIIGNAEDNAEIEIHGDAYYVLKKNVGTTKYKLCYLIREDILTKDATVFKDRTLLVIAIVFIIILAISTLYSRRLRERLNRITIGIDKYKCGEWDYKIEDNANDELSLIAEEFNDMGGSISELMRNNLLIEKKRQDAEKEMLKSQITPHFLFNSLESIQMYSVIKGQKEVSNLVAILGRLLRLSMSEGAEIVPVSKEIEFIELYLKMMKIRHNGRLDYEIAVAEELKNSLMMKFTLQPIVENAIIHGYKQKAEDFFVSIQGKLENNKLYFTIEDNGAGISTRRMEEINSWLKEKPDEHTRIGLKNVHDRISLFYKGQGSIHIESIENGGTRVHLEFPDISKGEIEDV